MKNLFTIIATLCLLTDSVAQEKPARIQHAGPGRAIREAREPAARGTAPANDDCANAQPISFTVDCSSPIAGTTTDATQDGATPGCDLPGTYLDVWYTLNTGANDTIALELLALPGMDDWDIAVYDACGGTELACATLPQVPVNVEVPTNTDLWIRVWTNTSYDSDGGDFTLCVTGPVYFPVPPNDLCADAMIETLAIGAGISFTGNNEGSTDTEGLGVPNVWHAFTTTECTDITIDYCGNDPQFAYFMIAFYTDCDLTYGFTAGSYGYCAADSNFTMCFSDIPAGTYYYPVGQFVGASGPYQVNVSAVACGTNAPVNDDCAGAVDIVPHATCITQGFAPSCASQSLPAVNCNGWEGVANDDVWYRFTATTSDMSIGVDPHGNMDPVVQAFSGTCGSLFEMDCADAGGQGLVEDLQLSGLSVGTTYYFRVYDYRPQYTFLDPGYDLCVVEGLGSGVGVQEAFAELNGRVCPNPSNGTFTIRANSGAMITAVQVVDAAGRTMLRSTSNTAHGPLQVDASALTPGAYVVRYTDSGTLKNERLIIQ